LNGPQNEPYRRDGFPVYSFSIHNSNTHPGDIFGQFAGRDQREVRSSGCEGGGEKPVLGRWAVSMKFQPSVWGRISPLGAEGRTIPRRVEKKRRELPVFKYFPPLTGPKEVRGSPPPGEGWGLQDPPTHPTLPRPVGLPNRKKKPAARTTTLAIANGRPYTQP